ncbi:ATP-binding cassette domain-containing protein [Subsaximicrobium wynnwilliamsii]|uniref:ATP-binding cassette domain-containing protein n=1 Tax=Subsaximicrobium wynnwilliamsii TaxID=291179 RepID=UPI001CB925BF|nr:ATP-binding cassette domain-containing protein [Subsaximicrobium wynnwilliamsii]
MDLQREEEEEQEQEQCVDKTLYNLQLLKSINSGIRLKNLSFNYDGSELKNVLKNLNLFIPKGKTTAIVGASGSGKTTLMKLLLKFYEPRAGNIYVDGSALSTNSAKNWRKRIGAVMQEGYIFSDRLERNIAAGVEKIDQELLKYAIETANLTEFLEELPNGLKTRIGASGNGISGGQKQRILIARTVYKNQSLFFLMKPLVL